MRVKKMREKMDLVHRAKQFLPFNSLKGFYDLILEQEKIKTSRRHLTIDEIEMINEKIVELKVNQMVIITHYVKDGYVNTQGMITFIDPVLKTIKIVDQVIPIRDITDVKVI